MFSAWSIALAVPQLNLSDLEKQWTPKFWVLIAVSLVCFALGSYFADYLNSRFKLADFVQKHSRRHVNTKNLRILLYGMTAISFIGLWIFYDKAGNFPLLSSDTDVFRFEADEQVPGLINYAAQLARLYIPLAFFLIFYQNFSFKKHWDLVLLILAGAVSLILFASRTQIFFIDLWIMALYLAIRKPGLKQALKFYPAFLLLTVIMLSVVPLIRQYKSYGSISYLAGVTQIDSSGYNLGEKFLLPIYVGISFNMQALLHAQQYYEVYPIQMGRVALDPFTNILGIDSLRSNFDLSEIFYSWWNTGTYLFPFVQDFGNAGFVVAPLIVSILSVLVWRAMRNGTDFLFTNLYAYVCFFLVMTIYLSFTVRAEMYIDLFILLISYFYVCKKDVQKNKTNGQTSAA
jgi:oligosaccharide repeat unit polymerase